MAKVQLIIEDPQSCTNCPVRETNWPGGRACRITNTVCPVGNTNDPPSRPEWCPLKKFGGRRKKASGEDSNSMWESWNK